MTKSARARYTLEFKEEAVRLVTGGERVATVARNLGLSEQTLHNWVNSPLRNQSRADLLPADRVLEGARHGNGTVERSWESGVVGQPLGGGAGAAPLFLRPLQ
jgi:transposase-like protein